MGQWLDVFAPSIYATRRGPIPPRNWGVTTQRGDSIFVHVLDWPDRVLALPPLAPSILRAAMLRDGARVTFQQSDLGVVLTLPPAVGEEPDRVVVLVTRGRGLP